jgi:hypothetical protein
MAGATALGLIGGEIGKKILGLKNGGGALKTSSKKKGSSKNFKMRPVDPGMIHTGGYKVMKRGGKVKGNGRPVKRKRGGRIKR